ncbi:MAG TPA: NAD(+) diphosphatase [Anaerolineae bacterium]|nr:NAD(+) diphosphatase [Anaerolineae bacterium]
MESRFVSSVAAPTEDVGAAFWLIFRGNRVLVGDDGRIAALPLLEDVNALGLTFLRQHYLGCFTGDEPRHCFAAEVDRETEPPEGMSFQGIRRLFGRLPEAQLLLAGRAVQVIDWDRNHVFCGRCGARNEIQGYERSKKCPECGLVTYPRISPAIIVRVTRRDESGEMILLARGPRHRPGMYSVLAGFVEPGETLEDCVRREVMEEVGVAVTDIRYFGNQPWPFPDSLMIAFTAVTLQTDLTLQEEEIEDAAWFTADNLPDIPPPMSIAHALIMDFVERNS